MQDTLHKPLVLGPDDGEAVWFQDNRMTIKAKAAETGGTFGLLAAWAPAGGATPLHVHHHADEAFWILEGRLRIRCGEEEFTAGPGSFVLLPRGVPHAFVVEGGEEARLLIILSPGGSEAFFAEAGVPAEAPGLPAPRPVDLAALAATAERHGMSILGPPMEATS